MPSIAFVPPFENQLAAPTPTDGMPDENANNDCGETDVSWILRSFFNVVIPPDDIKDFLFGQGVHPVNSSMPDYVSYFAAHNRFFNNNDIPLVIDTLAPSVDTITTQIAAGHPVVLLIPSQWGVEPPNPATETSFHFVVAYAYDPTALTISCMNPWGGFLHSGSYTYWAERLRGGAVWAFRKVGEMVADITPLYDIHPDGSATFKANGALVGSGIFAKVKAIGLAWPPIAMREILRPGTTNQTYMPFSDGNSDIVIYWDGTQALVNSWVGHGLVSLEYALEAAQAANAKLVAAALQAQQQAQQQQTLLTQAVSTIAGLQVEVGTLSTELAVGVLPPTSVSQIDQDIAAIEAVLHPVSHT